MRGALSFSLIILYTFYIVLFFLTPSLSLPSPFLYVSASETPQCKAAHCNDKEIKCPLWIFNRSDPTGCGHPCLAVYCEKGLPELRLGGKNYAISNIVYEKTTTISLEAFDPRISPCLDSPPRQEDLVNFIAKLPGSFHSLNLSCSEKNGKSTILREKEDPEPCQDSDDREEIHDETEVYKDLQVTWVPHKFKQGCEICEKKRGSCLKEEFHGGRKGQNRRQKIFIGVGTGIGGIIISSLVFFFLYKRKEAKMRPNGSKLLSWTNSSKLSSTKDLENGTDSVGAPFFRYEELHDATDGFNPSNELGDGGFGTVYKGKLRDGRIVAVKRLYENNYKRVEQFMNEAAILNRLRHPNLVSLYGCTSRHSRELLLVYEFVPNGTVADHLHGHLATRLDLNWPLRLRIALETATALSYLHAAEPQIIHRDIKTNNILLDANFHVKVADFGLSRLFPMDVTHVSTAPQGTPGYVDPEYHQCYQLTDKSDVYSFGVVLVELISSMPAVDITRRRNEINLSSMAVNKIQSGQLGELVDPRLGFDSDPEVRGMVEVVAELAFRCLQSEKEMRPSMEEAVEVLLGISDGGGKERETTEAMNKIDEVVLLKAMVPPLSPESVMHKWSSRVTTPNASE